MSEEFTIRNANRKLSATSLAEPNNFAEKTCRCVLAAEDDPDDRFMLRRAWRKSRVPHRLIELTDGEQVVRYLSSHPPFDDRARYPVADLLLLDLKMPKLNGFDVLAWIQGRPDMKSLTVVVLSSSGLDTDREFALKLGARAFLTKPNESGQLLLLVEQLQADWLLDRTSVVQNEICVERSSRRVQSRQTG